jgi:hypothetical protein
MPQPSSTTSLPAVRAVRRIVTGRDAEGRSLIMSDGPSPHVMALAGTDAFGVTDIWKTDASPACNDGPDDTCELPIRLAPPAQGTVFRIVQFPPDKDYVGQWEAGRAFASMGDSGAHAIDAGSTRHEAMHRTQSIDYAFVLEGEIWAVLDTVETRMAPGDVLVQRGTNHAWSNRSNAPCVMGFVLIDAQPPSGHQGDTP